MIRCSIWAGCWQEPGEAPSHAIYMDWSGMPSRAEVAERYARATGLDVSNMNYYIALALFKLAAIMEGWYTQYLTGRSKTLPMPICKP